MAHREIGCSKSIMFLGKANDEHVKRAVQFCELNFSSTAIFLGDYGDKFPEEALSWQGDYIVSYLSRWIIPDILLRRAGNAAINFHPASPDYPGIGCNNFALYDGVDQYGVTCHHMAASVDTGPIIAVRRFPLYPTDGVESLLARIYDHQLVLFYEIIDFILRGSALPSTSEAWSRKAYTRKQLNELATITPGMSGDEIARRARATSFGTWRPALEIEGFRFELKGPTK